jgi:hypothetical protein
LVKKEPKIIASTFTNVGTNVASGTFRLGRTSNFASLTFKLHLNQVAVVHKICGSMMVLE